MTMLITQNQIPRDNCVAFSDEDLIVDLQCILLAWQKFKAWKRT